MKHTSVKLNTPVEFINVTPVNPLISKCQIKVCYVDTEPNRNGSIITKEVATEMANSLPGSPIVGFFNEETQDFEEHNREFEIVEGQLKIVDTTRPYGFVDLGAKVWFQKFLDDGEVEREYLMTEGYLWTGQYPECQRVIDKGNNQSMELDEKSISGSWTKSSNQSPEFFIINEAIISKLCILGEEFEPCFEGAQVSKVQFSFEDDFKVELFSMMKQIKEILEKGGIPVFTTYAVEIGDSLWSSLWQYLDKTYPACEDHCCGSLYRIEGIYEEEGQKFAILKDGDSKYFRLNFSLTEEAGFVAETELVEVTLNYTPAETPQFDSAAVEAFAAEYASKKKEEEKGEEEPKEGKEETCPKCGKPKSECECDDEGEEEDDDEKGKKNKYNLEEIQEYVELQSQFSALQETVNELTQENETLKETISSLQTFKASVDKKEKEEMIDSFYMLSDEDKKDVIANIDSYSLDEIEAKLSIICVRNKVNFSLLEEQEKEEKPGVNFNIHQQQSYDNTPEWVKRALEVADSM